MRKEDTEIVKVCLRYQNSKIGSNKNKSSHNRINKIIQYLDQIGLSDIWHKIMNEEDNLEYLKLLIMNKCNDISRQETFARLKVMKSLIFYNTIKKNWGKEEYI